MAAQFEKFKGTNNQFYFRLKAENGEQILRSEGYHISEGCDNGIASVRINAPMDERYYRGSATNGQYYFNLKSANGEVIGTSETYVTSSGMESGIASVKKNAPTASVVDLT